MCIVLQNLQGDTLYIAFIDRQFGPKSKILAKKMALKVLFSRLERKTLPVRLEMIQILQNQASINELHQTYSLRLFAK